MGRPYSPRAEPAGVHEQHVAGGVYPVQDAAAAHHRLQQDRRREARDDVGVDGGFRQVSRRHRRKLHLRHRLVPKK